MLPTKFRFIWPTSTNNCLCLPCSLTDRDEMNILHRRPYIDAFYQVSVHLAKGFQRRRLKCEKFTDGRRRRTSCEDNSSRRLWQGELKSHFQHSFAKQNSHQQSQCFMRTYFACIKYKYKQRLKFSRSYCRLQTKNIVVNDRLLFACLFDGV
jgi:hypothetical protein